MSSPKTRDTVLWAMLTISKPLLSSQAWTYVACQFATKETNYWSREQQGRSTRQDELIQKWGL
jgi:hypothetical protein